MLTKKLIDEWLQSLNFHIVEKQPEDKVEYFDTKTEEEKE